MRCLESNVTRHYNTKTFFEIQISLSRATSDIPLGGEYDVIMSNPSYNEAESDSTPNNLPVETTIKRYCPTFSVFYNGRAKK